MIFLFTLKSKIIILFNENLVFQLLPQKLTDRRVAKVTNMAFIYSYFNLSGEANDLGLATVRMLSEKHMY